MATGFDIAAKRRSRIADALYPQCGLPTGGLRPQGNPDRHPADPPALT